MELTDSECNLFFGELEIGSNFTLGGASKLIMQCAGDLLRVRGNFKTESTVSHRGLLTSGLFTMAFCADEIQATHFESSTCYSFANVDPDYAGYWTKDSMEESLPRLWDSATAGFQEALDELILSPNELVAAAGAVALDAYTHRVFGKVMLALMLGCTIKDLYDATAEPINMYERTRRYVKDVTVLFVTVMAEQYLEKVTEKVITKLSDTKFVRGFMDFVMEEDLLTGISDRILLARMYFAESDAEVFGKLSKYLEEDALTYLNAEIGKTGLKPRDVAKTLLKCARKNDDTTLSLDDARFILREMEGGAEESVIVSLFLGTKNRIFRDANQLDIDLINIIKKKYNAGKTRNAACAKGDINGETIDLECISGNFAHDNYFNKGNFEPPLPENYHYKGPKPGYKNHTEQKIVEYLREKYKSNTNISGEIEIISERPFCDNCRVLVDMFEEEFPNIKVMRVEIIK